MNVVFICHLFGHNWQSGSNLTYNTCRETSWKVVWCVTVWEGESKEAQWEAPMFIISPEPQGGGQWQGVAS